MVQAFAKAGGDHGVERPAGSGNPFDHVAAHPGEGVGVRPGQVATGRRAEVEHQDAVAAGALLRVDAVMVVEKAGNAARRRRTRAELCQRFGSLAPSALALGIEAWKLHGERGQR